jgi:hypothetical protein
MPVKLGLKFMAVVGDLPPINVPPLELECDSY